MILLEAASGLHAVLAALCIGFIAICGVVTVKLKRKGCFRCPCSSSDDAASVSEKETPNEMLPTVQLRKDVGRSGGRSNTWPWQNKRPPCSEKGLHEKLEVPGHGSSSVIFSSNSLCLKVVSDEESDLGHQFKGRVEVYNGEEEGNEEEEEKMDDIQSIVSDFEEEVLKGLDALDSSTEGMSDSLKNVAGSLKSMSAGPDVGGEGRCKVMWVVGDEESDIGDPVEMTDDEGDVALFISDDDDSDVPSNKDMVSLPDMVVTEADSETDGFDSLDSSELPIHPRSSSIMKYRYSMTTEEILCCSSNTSSLALESPHLGSFSGEDLDLRYYQGFPNSLDPLEDQRLSALRPFMLYRYSISLEEIQFPTHSLSRSIPAALLPLPLTTADDEESEVFYDALSTIGSRRSSIMDPQMESHSRNSLALRPPGRRSKFFSTSSDKSTPNVRRCSSLHDLL